MPEHKHPWHFATQAVHAGERAPRPDFTPIATPIYPAATFFYDDVADTYAAIAGERPGYSYTRYGNPTVAAFEEAVATLEGGESAVAYASGMAAVLGALLGSGVRAGESIVAAQDVYGATYSLLANFFPRFGVRTTFVDITDLAAVEAAVAQERPRALYCETMSNPLLKLADLDALAAIAHAHDALLLVDNTFTTPCLVQPLAHGADLVIHSATKYLGGHGDALGGIVLANSFELVEPLFDARHLTGGPISPFNAWLILRGLVTMPLRMRRHCENAARIAEFLAGHPAVTDVRYPGLASDPGHRIAKAQWAGFGGLAGFTLKGGKGAQDVFRSSVKLCKPWFSLGDSETLLLCQDADPGQGIPEGRIRVSAGLEDPEDIVADLDQALRRGQ